MGHRHDGWNEDEGANEAFRLRKMARKKEKQIKFKPKMEQDEAFSRRAQAHACALLQMAKKENGSEVRCQTNDSPLSISPPFRCRSAPIIFL
jgi:hypothetical protein